MRIKDLEMRRAVSEGRGGKGGIRRWILAALAFWAGVSVRAEEPSAAAAMRILQANCLSCHNGEKQKAGLNLATREALLHGSESGPVWLEAAPAESPLLKVLAAEADPHMPPKRQLSGAQIEAMSQWVRAGVPWDAAALAQAAAPREVKVEPNPAWHRPVLAVALTGDGNRLAFGRGEGIEIRDVSATNHPVLVSQAAHVDAVRALAWSPDGRQLASGSFREIVLWDAAARTNLTKIWSATGGPAGRVNALRFTPHGGALVAADGGWLRTLAPATGKELQAWEAHEDAIYDVSMSPDGGLVATAGGDKLAKFWELVSGREVARLEGHSSAVLGLSFNPNGSELVTVGLDKQLKAWDSQLRDSFVTIGGRANGLNAVRWSADGKTVVAADDRGGLFRFRNLKRHTGEQSSATAEERGLGTFDSPIQALAANVDASRIYAGTADGRLRVVNEEGKVLAEFAPEAAVGSEGPSFVRDVLPVMAKAGCMAGSCHAKPDGQNGFKLSVFSFDPVSDHAEIVREARGRRVFPAAPAESLLLLKPTMAVEHGGGQRLDVDSEAYRTIFEWVRQGMVYQHPNEPVLASVVVDPREASTQRGEVRPLKVEARYSDGSRRDVTHLADYISNDKEFAKVDEAGIVQVGQLSGEGVVVARFMGMVDAGRFTVPAEKTIPAERYAALPVHNFVDRLAWEHFRKLGLFPSEGSSDAEFARRSALDTLGRLPRPEALRRFLLETDPGKRRRWVESLLADEAYGDYWANKWADLLRPNPDRVGIKSVFVLDQWIRESFRENKPFDQFARDLLLAEGSNHREGPVVVYRDRREPPELTTLFSQVFLGVRMECAKCHHHPNEKWSQTDFYQFAAFFGGVGQKGAGLSPPISAGTEKFYARNGGRVTHPVTGETMKPRPLEANAPEVAEGEDPRRALANWVTNPGNPYFARAAVNRVWASYFGRGFVEPVDDFRTSNPVSNEPLLNALAADFAEHGFDLKHLMRTILNSHLYQLSSAPNETNLRETKSFARSYRRRLPAEVLLDAVSEVTGVPDQYAGCPPGTTAMQTWSYKISSHFMDAFGRPNSSSDCPCERDLRTSVVQSLHLMNSRELQQKLAHAEGRVRKLAEGGTPPAEIVRELYLAALSRMPSAEEIERAVAAFSAADATRQTAAEDVLWALLNSAEFVFNH